MRKALKTAPVLEKQGAGDQRAIRLKNVENVENSIGKPLKNGEIIGFPGASSFCGEDAFDLISFRLFQHFSGALFNKNP